MTKKNFMIGGVIIVVIFLGVFSLRNKQGLPSSPTPTGQLITNRNNSRPTTSFQKPRDKIIIYTAIQGDTLQSISEKFDISKDTIKWANNLTNENLTAGQTLKILPVTGVVHTVVQGETVASVAKKFHIDQQKIIDYPFNQFANPQTFSLTVGETLIVPDGIQSN